MDWLHGILNLIGLLFWVLWRAGTLSRPKPANHLVGPALRQGPVFKHSWIYLLALVGVLGLRAVFYNQFGPGLDWIPSLQLLHEVPHFRSDYFPRALAYSVLSFARWLGALYFCWALLATIRPTADTAKLWRSFLRAQFGWLGGLPAIALWIFAISLSAGLHWVEAEWMVHVGVRSNITIHIQQLPALVALDARAAVYLAMGVLILYLLNTFVYFGESHFWKNVHACGNRLLAPLSGLPLVVGKIDLAPFLALALVYALSFALRHAQLAAWFS